MGEVRIMHQVTVPHHAADGTVAYGPGELHEPGTLPEGVAYRVVAADDVQRATAPAHAQPAPKPAPAKEEKAAAAAPEAAEGKASAGTGTARK